MVDKLHVNVDITSDVVCPWCWVGKRHLDSAIETLSGEFEFHVHWKPFLLNPGMPDEGEPLEQHLRNKYGDAAIQRFLSDDSPLKQAGRAVGISFNPNRMVVPTKKAHILLAQAANEGKQHRLHEVGKINLCSLVPQNLKQIDKSSNATKLHTCLLRLLIHHNNTQKFISAAFF
jgi:predicted DsbA family dithiol-disulfide isomerase